MLEVRNLAAGYGKVQVLRDLTIDSGAGEILLLIGHNGAGKSTALKAIFGTVQAQRGSIRVGNRDVTHLSSSQRVKEGVSYMPQTSNEGRGIFPTHSVKENLELAAYTSKASKVLQKGFERAFTLFPELSEKQNQRAGLLSGGQQQMLAMSMALVLEPKLLLLDEPTSGLAQSIGQSLMQQVLQVRNSMDMSIIVVEQNVELAATIADRILVLRQGALHKEMSPEDITNASSVLDVI